MYKILITLKMSLFFIQVMDVGNILMMSFQWHFFQVTIFFSFFLSVRAEHFTCGIKQLSEISGWKHNPGKTGI